MITDYSRSYDSILEQQIIYNNPPIIACIISKLIEKIVARCIEKYLEHNDLNGSYQSVYCIGHTIIIIIIMKKNFYSANILKK